MMCSSHSCQKYHTTVFAFNIIVLTGQFHPKLDTDTSLASLHFTESSSMSMDGMSLEQVVQLLDRNLGELSPLDAHSSKRRVRHSTPDTACNGGNDGGGLELVGREVKTHVKTGAKTNRRTTAIRAGNKIKVKSGTEKNAKKGHVRNYNREDFLKT